MHVQKKKRKGKESDYLPCYSRLSLATGESRLSMVIIKKKKKKLYLSVALLIHTCDTFLSPKREIWNFWSGNLCLISGGFHVANF